MSDSVFVEEDSPAYGKKQTLDATSPLSLESSVGGLEVFVEEDEEESESTDNQHGSSNAIGGGPGLGNTIAVNGIRSVSVSPKPSSVVDQKTGKHNSMQIMYKNAHVFALWIFCSDFIKTKQILNSLYFNRASMPVVVVIQ